VVNIWEKFPAGLLYRGRSHDLHLGSRKFVTTLYQDVRFFEISRLKIRATARLLIQKCNSTVIVKFTIDQKGFVVKSLVQNTVTLAYLVTVVQFFVFRVFYFVDPGLSLFFTLAENSGILDVIHHSWSLTRGKKSC
jgi:hypothetical protein